VRTRIIRRLDKLVDNTKRVIAVNRNVAFFTTGYSYAIQLIPIVVVAPLYFEHRVEFGVITQAAMAFSQLVGAISIVINQFQTISSFAAVLSRLTGLRMQIREDGNRLGYEGLRIVDAEGRMLLNDLTLEVAHGTVRISVTGNPTARAALFRASAGLWPGAEGVLVRPPGEKVLFVTERPYLPPGTLREILVREWAQDGIGEGTMRKALRELGIEALLERSGGFDTEQSWSELFSLGEQQLVAIARVLLAAPLFAFLDRPSSAFDERERDLVMRVLADHEITALVFEDVRPGHEACDAVLDIADDATWTYHPHEPAIAASRAQ